MAFDGERETGPRPDKPTRQRDARGNNLAPQPTQRAKGDP